MIEDIWQVIANDTKQKLGFPLREVEGAGDLIRDLAKDYGAERLRAMWLYYLTDETEVRFGISVVAFSDPRRLARLAGRVSRKPKSTDDITTWVYYGCLKAHVPRADEIYSYEVSFKKGEGLTKLAELPLVYPEPCPVCNGPCYMSYDHARQVEAFAAAYPVGWIDPSLLDKGLRGVIGAVADSTAMPPAAVDEETLVDFDNIEDFF